MNNKEKIFLLEDLKRKIIEEAHKEIDIKKAVGIQTAIDIINKEINEFTN